jgi:predicted permease
VAEVALSVMLLAGAGLLIRSFTRLMDVDPGFRTASSISFGISLPNAKYGNADKQSAFMTELMDRIKAIPGVEKAGAAYGLPLTNFSFSFSFEVAGAPAVRPQDQPDAEVRVATASYFPAIGIRILRGRGFTDADRNGSTPVLLITETGAKQFFAHEDPVGKHVTFGWGNGRGKPFEGDIVGIVGDTKQSSLATATLPQFYAPFDQRPVASFSVVLHTARDPQLAVADARRVVHEMDPDLAVSQIKLLDQIVAESVAQPRFYMVLLAALAFVAVALAAVGIYGVIAYLVGQRTREIGIRIALGAPTSRVVRLVVGEGALLAALGLMGGLAGAFALTRLMGTLLYDIKPTDPVTYIVTATFFVGVALVAAFVPAMRATRVDPVWAMRAE